MTAPAYRADGRPIERAAFYALACDPRRSCVVEACAGAGKTWMLVSRILRALLEGDLPQEILAITFTRKAAGEMRERLDDWLAEFAAPETPHSTRVQALRDRGLPAADAERLAPRLQGLQEEVLLAGRPVEIRTFHAWFAQLLRAAPLELLNELGLSPDMELVEAIDDHRPEVFRRFHAALLRDPALLADYQALVGERGRSQARRWLEAALEKRVEIELADAAGVLDDSVPAPSHAVHSGDPAEVLLGATWQHWLGTVAQELGRGGAGAQDAAARLLAAMAPPAEARAVFTRVRRALFTTDDVPRVQLRKVAAAAELQDALDALTLEIRQFDGHVEHRRMVRLARVLLAEYSAYKRSRGLADMADLERCGLALLRDSTLAGWLQERLDARIRHLLIDEFQDTSPLQWQALQSWLSGYGGAGGGTSGQRPPGVFIVGDPKQSIYRFRRAEPRVFEAAKGFVTAALAGRVLACDHTRRNAPAVLEALNAVFVAATDAGEFSGFRAHTTEVADRPGSDPVTALPRVPRPPRSARIGKGEPPIERIWRDTLTVPRHEPEEVLREQEAAGVARAVQALLLGHSPGGGAPVAPGDIMILSRKRESLRHAAQALRRLGIPHAAVEEFDLAQAPEAADLIALLDVLVSPRHRLSLARVLRSPLFGAVEEDLIVLARAAKHDDWWRALLDGAHASPVLARAARLLRGWHLAASRLPPHDLLDLVVHEGDLRARVAAAVPPEQRLAAEEAIDAVLGQALTLDGARYATPYNFVRALKRRAVRVAPSAVSDSVRLLTVHGAKGLEAQVVFVIDSDPEAKKAETATLLIEWPVESAAPRRCAFVYSEKHCPPALQPALDAELEARRVEELNGLYVAMSRARERLVFSATEPHLPSRVSWWQRLAPLAVPWQLADVSFASRLSPTAPLSVLASVALPRVALPAARLAGFGVETDATRLGKALHRFLEWAADAPAAADRSQLAHAAATEFGAPSLEVLRLGGGILDSRDCARFFAGPGLRWAGNEVPLSDAGEALRIDRLVLIDGDDGSGPVWWVLDYKLQHAPAELPAYRAQLQRYRRVVRFAQPGAVVRCAFITGAGAVVEIE